MLFNYDVDFVMVTFTVPIVALPTGVPPAVILIVLFGALDTAVLTAESRVNELFVSEKVAVSPFYFVNVAVIVTAAFEWFTTFTVPVESVHPALLVAL